MKKPWAPLVAILLVLPALTAANPAIRGTFALQGQSPKAEGYLTAGELSSDPLNRRLDTWMTPLGSGVAIRTYDVDMTKLLHMIIVSDDFRTFLHVHPVLGPSGHFLLNQRFPDQGLYHIYIDARPTGFGQQVFRFDLGLGGAAARASRDLGERGTTTRAGPYFVSISTDTLAIGSESHLVIHILKDGKPASDLHPYLGALAHAVFLNAGDLSYVHAHPLPLSASGEKSGPTGTAMGMKPLPDSASSSPNMRLHVALREPGTYKLWLQFRGGNGLYVATFVLTARTTT
ncbi:MAG: hypothetical protein WA812_07975 [Candidatus Cybelea sp.]